MYVGPHNLNFQRQSDIQLSEHLPIQTIITDFLLYLTESKLIIVRLNILLHGQSLCDLETWTCSSLSHYYVTCRYHPHGKGISVQRGNAVTGNPRPPQYLSKHAKMTCTTLAKEAKDTMLSVRKMLEAECKNIYKTQNGIGENNLAIISRFNHITG